MMMTTGSEHAEEDIPAAIQRAQKRHQALKFIYARPFKVGDVAQFSAIQVEQLS